jgi:PAS domain S-box-containing protein
VTQESAISAPAPSRLLNILAIEDSPYDAELLLQELLRAGLQVRMDVAKTAVEAVAFLLGGSYDLVLSDFGLKGWTGLDALQLLRERQPDLPFILVTGSLGDEKAAECIKLGATDFVLKDRLNRLPYAVTRALEEKAQRAQKRAAEVALRESEDRFRRLVEISPEAIFVGCRGEVVFINPAGMKLFGAQEESELVGKTVADLVHPDFQQIVYQKIEQHEGTDSPVSALEQRFRRLDGTLVDVEVSAIPLQWKGRASLQVVARDITERKRAEGALRLQAAALEAAEDEIVITDSNGNMEWVNPAFTRTTGYTAVEALGQNPRLLKSGKQDDAFYKHLWNTVLSGQAWEGVITNRRKDGTFYEVHKVIAPVRSEKGKISHFVAIGQDITERRRVEEALRLSEAAFRSLVEHSPYGIYRSNLRTSQLLMVNPALVKMLGYDSAEELLGHETAREVYRASGDRASAVAKLERGEVVRNLEVHWKRKDGGDLAVHISGTIAHGEDGESYFEVIAEDVTERLALEQQLRQAQKMEAVGRLAGGIAHDFNNLLTVIRGYAELMLEETDREKLRSRAQNIIKASDRTAALTRQLLAFSRKQVLWPQVLDLNAIVAEARKMLPTLIGEDVRVIVLPGPKLGRVKADPGQLEQVLMNLAINARDAMPKGGKLVLETANVECDKGYCALHPGAQPGSYVMLAVSDNGCGMDLETQSHIFEPFFTTKAKDKGTGLGLATVYGIVKQSGGHLWVYSEPGVGTTFKVYLPQVQEKTAAAPLPPRLAEKAEGSETILLVEDQEDIRAVAREFLEQRGYRVLEARNGTEALEVAARHVNPIHLLVTDMVMPGMRGRELAEKLCSSRPQVKVLYVSGYTDGSMVENGELGPGSAFLEKPFSSDALARRVRQVLNGASPGSEQPAGTEAAEPAEKQQRIRM